MTLNYSLVTFQNDRRLEQRFSKLIEKSKSDLPPGKHKVESKVTKKPKEDENVLEKEERVNGMLVIFIKVIVVIYSPVEQLLCT